MEPSAYVNVATFLVSSGSETLASFWDYYGREPKRWPRHANEYVLAVWLEFEHCVDVRVPLVLTSSIFGATSSTFLVLTDARSVVADVRSNGQNWTCTFRRYLALRSQDTRDISDGAADCSCDRRAPLCHPEGEAGLLSTARM